MCQECNGNFNNCPVCSSDEMEEVTCPECNGFPEIYINDSGIVILKEEWDALPEDERDVNICEKCKGAGVILVEM